MRLEAGETEWEGRLEVCYSGRWGTVSSEGWTQVNTQVICNDLGYDITGQLQHIVQLNRDKYSFWCSHVQVLPTLLYHSHCQSQFSYKMLPAVVQH